MVALPPIEYAPDGTVSYSVVGPSAEIEAAIEAMSDPVEVTVDAVSGIGAAFDDAATTLSDRQREAAETGLELGYYDVPRTASQEDVADALRCAPSTAAEHLQKAEAALVRAVLDRPSP